MLRTYNSQSPADIRSGDKVTDFRGRTFITTGMAEFVLGDYHVNGYLEGSSSFTSFTIDGDSLVTISYEEEFADSEVDF